MYMADLRKFFFYLVVPYKSIPKNIDVVYVPLGRHWSWADSQPAPLPRRGRSRNLGHQNICKNKSYIAMGIMYHSYLSISITVDLIKYNYNRQIYLYMFIISIRLVAMAVFDLNYLK